MIIIIAIALSLLTIVAGLFLLAKTRKDQLGKVYSACSYAVIIIGGLLLGSSLCGCFCKMMCYKGCRMEKMECRSGASCMANPHHQGMGNKMMFIEKHCEMKMCGENKGCKKEMGNCPEGHKCEGGMNKDCCKKDKAASCHSNEGNSTGENKEVEVIVKEEKK